MIPLLYRTRPGEVLRQSEPQQADRGTVPDRERRESSVSDTQIPQCRGSSVTQVRGDQRGRTARRPVESHIEQHPAQRAGQGAGAERTPVCALCRRLHDTCEKSTGHGACPRQYLGVHRKETVPEGKQGEDGSRFNSR